METKTCNKCQKSLPSDSFGNSTPARDGKLSTCKKCRLAESYAYRRRSKRFKITHARGARRAYRRKRTRLFELYTQLSGKAIKCEKCPETHLGCLDFHHVDRNQKSFTIGNTSNIKTIEQLTEEIKKCIILCANCHRKHHWDESEQKNIKETL